MTSELRRVTSFRGVTPIAHCHTTFECDQNARRVTRTKHVTLQLGDVTLQNGVTSSVGSVSRSSASDNSRSADVTPVVGGQSPCKDRRHSLALLGAVMGTFPVFGTLQTRSLLYSPAVDAVVGHPSPTLRTAAEGV